MKLHLPVLRWWHGRMSEVSRDVVAAEEGDEPFEPFNTLDFVLGGKRFSASGKEVKTLEPYAGGDRELRLCFESTYDFDTNEDHRFIEGLERIGEDVFRITFLGS